MNRIAIASLSALVLLSACGNSTGERALSGGAIGAAGGAIANHVEDRAIEPRDDHSVMVGVGHEQTSRGLIGEHFPGKGKNLGLKMLALERDGNR
jgi:hypothetical protein